VAGSKPTLKEEAMQEVSILGLAPILGLGVVAVIIAAWAIRRR
jgi:hypothetical protein